MKRSFIPCAALTLFLSPAARAGWHNGGGPDLVIGNQLSGARFFDQPESVITGPGGVVFVCDTGHHRVLRFSAASAAAGGLQADAVFGQGDFDSCDNGGPSRLNSPHQICLDPAGNLWVADTENNRVLRYANALTVQGAAKPAAVLGQPDFMATDSSDRSATILNSPCGVAADGLGHLWVADRGNSRVLLFLNAAAKTSGAPADKVLGQPLFTTDEETPDAAGMNGPVSLAAELYGAGKVRLWVADQWFHRVLRWDDALSKANGAPADGVLGQADFKTTKTGDSGKGGHVHPGGVAVDASGRLWVANTEASLVFRYENAATLPPGALPAGMWKTDFPTGIAPDGAGGLWVASRRESVVRRFNSAAQGSSPQTPAVILGGTEGHSLKKDRVQPDAVAVDPVSRKLFVAESGNNRVLRYASVEALASGQAPEAALGQFGFFTVNASSSKHGLDRPSALAFTPDGSLWVADQGNHRVVRYDHAADLSSGAAVSFVLGQTSPGAGSSGKISAGTFYIVSGLCADGTSLWVADSSWNRVLRFDGVHGMTLAPGGSLPQPVAASRVYGQNSFTAGEGGVGASRLQHPQGLAVEKNGRLWVADSHNNRVLTWEPNAPSMAAASKVLGQLGTLSKEPGAGTGKMRNPRGVAVDGDGRLWVADTGNHRILRWEPSGKISGAAAGGVLGAPGPGSVPLAGCGAATLNAVRALCTDGSNRLYAADQGNYRVLRFSPAAPVITAFTRMPGAGITMSLSFKGEPSTPHRIQGSFDLKTWFTAKEITTTPQGTGTATLTSLLPSLYYRVAEMPLP